MTNLRLAVSVMAVAAVFQACNPDSDREDMAQETPGGGAMTTPATPSGDTARQSDSAAGNAAAGGNVALGNSIFHGRTAGGTCFSCHGQDGAGTTLAPNLTDSEWLDAGGGTQASIAEIIKNGVPKPKKFQAPMPPMGGARLSDEQVNAVAAYVYSLSHK